MPNHCENDLRIIGSTEAVDKVLEAIKDDENRHIDFRKIIPQPEILQHTGSGYCTIDEVERKSWYIEEDGSTRAFTEEEQAELDKIGAENWYDWCTTAWGTKWNAYDQSLEVEYESDDFKEVLIAFSTAWGAADKVMEVLGKKYSALEGVESVTLTYFEMGAQFNGIMRYENGEETQREQGAYFGNRGG